MKTVKLKGDYRDRGYAEKTIKLREPRWPDYFAIGPISEYQKDSSGAKVLLVHEDRIESYAERLVAAESQEILPALSLTDTLAVRDAIADFFSEAWESLTPPSITSSGDADGDQPISPS